MDQSIKALVRQDCYYNLELIWLSSEKLVSSEKLISRDKLFEKSSL